ncbi:MAG: protein kinase [Deltaproteobacteria bacterium]|nr:protein kinase [Deltaproteobacteria bacterium]
MKSCPRCNLRYPDSSTSCFLDGSALVQVVDPRLGTVLAGRYLIERVLAEGGMGVVYVARHRLVDRPCAVKIMSATHSRNKVVRERFRREAKAAQQLAHPNIIEIFDQGETDDGMPYLVMELLEGEPLSEVLKRGPMQLPVALPILIQIARALARAHDFDVIHRDLKPDNIFIRIDGTQSTVKLLDFGIARSLHEQRLTAQGEVFGSPQYMAPERFSSIDAGAAADLYAVGVIAFEMLAGRLPFGAEDVGAILVQHLTAPVPSLAEQGLSVPPQLDALVRALMAKAPTERPVDAHRVHAELVEICNGLHIAPPTEPDKTVAEDWEPPKSLPPTALDRWARRILTFEQMLRTAYGPSPPAAMRRLVDRIREQVDDVRFLRSQEAAEQDKLEVIEAREREGRQRFGFAADALGVDVSRARNEARQAHLDAAAAASHSTLHASRLRQLQSEIRALEEQAGAGAPPDGLAVAYRSAADEIDAWQRTLLETASMRQRADQADRIVVDLEYQIQELRAGLTRLEQSSERERAQVEATVIELGRRAETLQNDLLQLATELCTPLRSFPALAPMFLELEADG